MNRNLIVVRYLYVKFAVILLTVDFSYFRVQEL